MSHINLQVIGNVGRISELRTTQTGKEVINFTVAANERVNGEDRTTWVEVTAWNGLATMLSTNLVAGQLVMVEGTPNTKLWTDKSGQAQTSLTLSAQTFRFLGGRPQ